MCHQFMTLFSALELEDDQPVINFALHVFATIAVNLMDSVSIFNTIKGTDEEVASLTGDTHNYFIGHCMPAHTKQIEQELGVGLGVNTMEG